MTKQRKPTAAKLASKIHEAKGNVSAVARAYNVPRSTVYGWIQSSEAARQALADEREAFVDVAESILYKRVVEDESDHAVFYVLNNMDAAKRRGWGPKSQVEHSGETAVRITWGDNADD